MTLSSSLEYIIIGIERDILSIESQFLFILCENLNLFDILLVSIKFFLHNYPIIYHHISKSI